MEHTRILLVDDHALIRNGMRNYLSSEGHIEIVGEAASAEQALTLLETLPVDLVIMDISMGGMNGIQATREVRDRFPQTKVLALSMMNEEAYIRGMYNAGACGYVLKNSDESDILVAVNTVIEGGTYFSQEVMEALIVRKKEEEEASVRVPLTDREMDVVQLIVKAYTNQEIANKLFISMRTVDTHKRNILEKTGARNIAGLVLYAIKNKLVDDTTV